ncbi:hypothetical protein C8F04DRAFT_1258526 [Mycena alexandri]|uniref:Uncharacterized protein n=1 Tax=Mycena alexandri TaxID=1745969 RepID=A0AAD6SY14_9AGAR|nr:hypothetical protein C8F04DRAFT_1258526 [Mycena alexandri]
MTDTANPHIDLLKNRNPEKRLGAFDSRVSAVVRISGTPYFITTNTDYIPTLPLRESHTITLRKDYRFGEDDYTRWPQQYSERFCHLAAIPEKKPDAGVMWWDPQRSDFLCPDTGNTLTHGLGRLRASKLGDLLRACVVLDDEYLEYEKLLAPNKPLPLFSLLAQQIKLSLERLKTLPLPWGSMVAVVTHLQRAYLEFLGLLHYMKFYKPRMETRSSEVPSLAPCVGAFVSDALVAPQFYAAGLPYWLLRPTFTFKDENILEIVELMEPALLLELEPAPGFHPIPTAPGTYAKIEAMRAAWKSSPLYCDPFESGGASGPAASSSSDAPSAAGFSTIASPTGHTVAAGPSGGGGRRGGGGSQGGKQDSRYQPYGRPNRPGPSSSNKGSSGRNKFKLLECAEMPPSVTAFERGLLEVDTTRTPISPGVGGRYVFPEPALLVSSPDYERRQLMLHHYTLIQDALLYRLGNPGKQRTITTQQWRDILAGKVVAQGRGKAGDRSVQIAAILAPALDACGLDGYRDFPAAPGSFNPIPVNRAREILWGIAESNFRFEFLALDCRASGMVRPDDCRKCFAGDTVMAMPLEEGKRGLAALTSAERHKYFLRIAKLMEAWIPRPGGVIMQANAAAEQEWDRFKREELETEVGRHYTQTFFDYFGRAAVIPLRLEHAFGS